MVAHPKLVWPPLQEGSAGTMLGIGITHIILGVFEIIVNGAAIATWSRFTAYVAPGFWSGFGLILAGAFGVSAARQKSSYLSTVFLCLSCLGLLLAVAVIACSIIGIVRNVSQQGDTVSSYVINSLLLSLGLIQLGTTFTSIVLVALAVHAARKLNRQQYRDEKEQERQKRRDERQRKRQQLREKRQPKRYQGRGGKDSIQQAGASHPRHTGQAQDTSTDGCPRVAVMAPTVTFHQPTEPHPYPSVELQRDDTYITLKMAVIKTT